MLHTVEFEVQRGIAACPQSHSKIVHSKMVASTELGPEVLTPKLNVHFVPPRVSGPLFPYL